MIIGVGNDRFYADVWDGIGVPRVLGGAYPARPPHYSPHLGELFAGSIGKALGMCFMSMRVANFRALCVPRYSLKLYGSSNRTVLDSPLGRGRDCSCLHPSPGILTL